MVEINLKLSPTDRNISNKTHTRLVPSCNAELSHEALFLNKS
jgi:hypothetical protein